MTRLLLAACSLIALILLGCSSEEDTHPYDELDPLAQKISIEAVDTIHSATAVTAYRVSRSPQDSHGALGPYFKVSEGRELTELEADALHVAVLDSSNYEWVKIKKNLFVPEIGYVFEKEGKIALVFVSLSSRKVEFHYGERVFQIDSDPGHQLFVDLVHKTTDGLGIVR